MNILVWIGFALNILCCIGGYFLVESPAWLNTFGDKPRAIEIIKYIARFNGTEDFEIIDLKDEKFEIVDPDKDKQNQNDKKRESVILMDSQMDNITADITEE